MVPGKSWNDLGGRLVNARRYESHAFWSTQNIRRGTILYESFSGNGMLCNPEAIFQQLLRDPQMQHLKHIWVLAGKGRYGSTVQRYRHHRNVTFVEYHSDTYYKALATSEYLVNNATFPLQFSKREGQIYLNTWHGTPLKRMGYDIAGGGPDTRNVVRNFVAADYLLSANPFMTEQMYLTAYKLRNAFRGAIIEEGFPRIDRQRLSADDSTDLRARLAEAHIALDERLVILYAPTWQGESFYRPVNDAPSIKYVVEHLEDQLDSSKYRILVKTHQVISRDAAPVPELEGYLVPNDIPANLVLGAVDLLVTDYSSMFFDFLATGKPVLFHLPDLDDYAAARGLYLSPDELPGQISTDLPGLAENIRMLEGPGSAQPSERYRAAREKFCPSDDGGASERIVDIVFKGAENYNVHRDFTDGRESILIYLGGMAPNGITASVLNLLDNIDHSRFDVSAFYSYSRAEAKKRSEAAINQNVRLFPRQGGLNGNRLDRWHAKRHQGKGRAPAVSKNAPEAQVWRNEWRRCFGESTFDYIVDFSGYGPFWDYILLNGEAKTHSIWLHNDLRNDSERTIDGEQPLRRGLEAVFSTYSRFDRLVSVSSSLAEINRRKLAVYAAPEKFVSAVNTVNAGKILHDAFGDAVADPPGAVPASVSPSASALEDADGPQPPDSLPAAVAHLKRRYPLASVAEEVERELLIDTFMPKRSHGTTFVTVGRLSPEKNHARLLRAFALVHDQDRRARLVIIGDGPLAAELRDFAAQLGLTHSVSFTGHQSKAAALMAAADCIVVSSDYEGQPMVILEALILGLPVLTTAFESARSALPEGAGMVVAQDDMALAEGMRAAIRGEIATQPFDAVAYDEAGMDEFYRAIGADSAWTRLPRTNMP